jgi:hypothetical protein
VTESIDKLVNTLLRAPGSAEWSTTTEHFEQTMEQYASDVEKWIGNMRSNETKLAAQEVVQILEAIRVRARGPFKAGNDS